MAAPPAKTLSDLNGKWIMNKTLSDDFDRILEMQGVGWFLRKAISFATITLTISEYVEDGKTHVDISQVATGGIQGTTEKRTLDWVYRDHKDGIFGSVKGKSQWVKLADVDDDQFLKRGYDDMDGEHIQAYVESKDSNWTADQVWGFEVIDGKRFHVRHVVVRKGDDWKQARLVYDYQGSANQRDEEDDGLAY